MMKLDKMPLELIVRKVNAGRMQRFYRSLMSKGEPFVLAERSSGKMTFVSGYKQLRSEVKRYTAGYDVSFTYLGFDEKHEQRVKELIERIRGGLA